MNLVDLGLIPIGNLLLNAVRSLHHSANPALQNKYHHAGEHVRDLERGGHEVKGHRFIGCLLSWPYSHGVFFLLGSRVIPVSS